MNAPTNAIVVALSEVGVDAALSFAVGEARRTRHHLLPLGSHLGSVARAAIGHAACPVLINPELAVATAELPYSTHLAAIGRPAEAS